MHSKNKPAMTAAERAWVSVIKGMTCGVCKQPSAEGQCSEAHELEQGLWFTSIPLCASCHRDNFNGIHGQRRMWKIHKLDEITVLNETIREIMRNV